MIEAMPQEARARTTADSAPSAHRSDATWALAPGALPAGAGGYDPRLSLSAAAYQSDARQRGPPIVRMGSTIVRMAAGSSLTVHKSTLRGDAVSRLRTCGLIHRCR